MRPARDCAGPILQLMIAEARNEGDDFLSLLVVCVQRDNFPWQFCDYSGHEAFFRTNEEKRRADFQHVVYLRRMNDAAKGVTQNDNVKIRGR